MLEDFEPDAELQAKELHAAGLEIDVHRVDARDAFITDVDEWHPDVILADFEVPGFLGDEAFEIRRQLCPHTPFIFLSSTISEDLAGDLIRAGATDYVLKERLQRLPAAIERSLIIRDITARKMAEQDLQQSEAEYRSLIENSPDVITKVSKDGVLTFVSNNVELLAGITPEDLIGRDFGSILEQFGMPKGLIGPVVRKSMETGKPQTVRYDFPGPEGTVVFETRLVSELDDGGEVLGVLGFTRDVTALTTAERELAARERELGSLTESSPDVISRFDRRLKHLYVSPMISQWSGLPAEAFIGKTWSEVAGLSEEAPLSDWEEEVGGVFETGRPATIHTEYEGPHGSLYMETKLIPEKDAAGDVITVLTVARDITERELAQQQLAAQERQFRMLAENLPDNLSRFDRDLRFVYIGPRLLIPSSIPTDQLIAKTIAEGFTDLSAEVVAKLEEGIKRSFRTHTKTAFEVSGTLEERAYVWSCVAVPERNESGEIETVLLISRDVTQGRVDEELLRESLEHLRQVDEQRRTLLAAWMRSQEEERSNLASDIHDDSIQVMTAAMLRIEVLKHGLNQEQREALETVQETVETAIARLRSMMFQLKPPTLDREGLVPALRLLVDQMRQEMPTDLVIEDTLTSQPDPQTRVIIYRIAQEALTNIRKHAHANAVRIELSEHEGGYLTRIVDDGVGFASEEPHVQLPGHLGFSDMRQRAEMFGGWFLFDSTPGEGTNVEYWIPKHAARHVWEAEG